jgi:hypothetical protein
MQRLVQSNALLPAIPFNAARLTHATCQSDEVLPLLAGRQDSKWLFESIISLQEIERIIFQTCNQR